jgi:phenylpropionate dioxygenase-like ring-hydroxylating dioxygenase large terminal subunit
MWPPADPAPADITAAAAQVRAAWPALHGHWFIACTSRQLRRRPLARTMLGVPLVVFRGAGGQPAALLDRCPHRNVALADGRVKQGCVACPYHGWQFDGAGVCQAVPGLPPEQASAHPARAVPAYATVEQQGFVWVYLGDAAPRTGPPRFTHLGEPGYAGFGGEAGLLTAALPDTLENFLDGTHTHFVHAGLIRREGQRRAVAVTVRRSADGAEAEYPEGPATGLIARLFGAGLDRAVGAFQLPCLATLDYWAGPRLKLGLRLHFTPVALDRVRLFGVGVAAAPAALGRLAEPVLIALLRYALRQDAAILAAQAANLARFGGPRYTYTALDVLGPHLRRLLKHGPSAVGAPAETVVRMQL